MGTTAPRLDDLGSVRKLFTGSGARRGRLFCPSCGDFRSMDAHLVFEPPQAVKARAERDRLVKLANAASISSGPPPRPGPEVPCPAAPAILAYLCREVILVEGKVKLTNEERLSEHRSSRTRRYLSMPSSAK